MKYEGSENAGAVEPESTPPNPLPIPSSFIIHNSSFITPGSAWRSSRRQALRHRDNKPQPVPE